MFIKFFIVITIYIFSFSFFILLDFFEILNVDSYTLFISLLSYFSIAFVYIPEINKIPLSEKYEGYNSFIYRAINCDVLEIRSLARKRMFFNKIIFSIISCFLYPVIFIFWFVQFFNVDLAGKLLCFLEPNLAKYFYKDYVYKVENVVENGKEYEKWYWTSSVIEWRLNGLLHRETDIAIECDIENCEYHNIKFFYCAFGKKYKKKEEMEKALISNSFNNF